MYESLRWSHFGRLVQPTSGVVVAQRGLALPQATLLIAAFRLVFGPTAALLPGVPPQLRLPSGCNDVKNGRVAIAADLSTAMGSWCW